MVAPSPAVKSVAKDALNRQLLKSVTVCCVAIFAFFIISLTSSLISVFAGEIGYSVSMCVMTFLVLQPLLLGVLSYFRRLVFDQDDSVLIIFRYFSNLEEYRRAMTLISMLTIRFILSAAILFLPCIVVYILSTETVYNLLDMPMPSWTSNLWTLNSFLAIFAAFGLVFVMLRYYLAPFIFVSNDELDPAEAVNMSKIIAKRTGADFFGLVLSFIPWLLLSIFVAPLIFTLPYFVSSYCVHCRFAINDYNRDVDKFNASATPSFSTDEI